MDTVFDVLANDHAEVRNMLAELMTGPTLATGASEDELMLRKRMTEQLVIAESAHEAVEEMFFWPAVRERVADGGALADEAAVQEQTAKEVLNRLDKLEASEATFEDLLGMFIPAALQHIEFEEIRVWPALSTQLSVAEAEELGGQIIVAKQAAPTRPHPRVPGTPGVQKTVGPLAGIADQIRDAMTGRGE
jgi:hemerythrin-like domain-containing protein